MASEGGGHGDGAGDSGGGDVAGGGNHVRAGGEGAPAARARPMLVPPVPAIGCGV